MMRSLVLDFQWTNLDGLRYVIDRLDVLWLEIQGQDDDWDRRFRRSWEALEEAYAVMLDRNMSTPDSFLKELIDLTMQELQICITHGGAS